MGLSRAVSVHSIGPRTVATRSRVSLGSLRRVIKLSGIIASVAVPRTDCILRMLLTIRSLSRMRAEMGAPEETGEVNQPMVPLDVNDYSMGGSMTGYFDFDG
ncbi:hypothetical protein YC2023_018327 [Brassica napus]